jgi:tetratricopeptide (TPR) repeat protein
MRINILFLSFILSITYLFCPKVCLSDNQYNFEQNFTLEQVPSNYFPKELSLDWQLALNGNCEKVIDNNLTNKAIKQTRKISSKESNKVFFLRAICLANLKKYQEALPEIDSFLSLHPSSTEGLYIKAIILRNSGKLTEALSTMEEAQFFGRASFVTPSMLYLEKASIYLLQELKEKAVAELGLALSSNPNASIYTLLGQIYFAKSDKANALLNFRQAVNLAPQNKNSLLFLARTLLINPSRITGKREIEEANHISSELIKDPTITKNDLYIANEVYIKSLIELGELNKARAHLKPLIKARPQDIIFQSLRDQIDIEERALKK